MLESGIVLYHGSYTVVKVIDLNKCNAGLDFGKGFYLTTSKNQAANFIATSIKKAIKTKAISKEFDVNNGQVSSFEFINNQGLKVLLFQEADVDWLHFVVAHRRPDLFPEIVKKYIDYDLVIGKVADDQTRTVIGAYSSGAYGKPGSSTADAIAIQFLLTENLKDQYCFRTQKAIDCLRYIGSESYGKIRSYR